MAKGDYLGGSIVVGPKSGWFSFKPAKKKKTGDSKPQMRAEEIAVKQAKRDNFFAMLQRTGKLSTSSPKRRKRRRK